MEQKATFFRIVELMSAGIKAELSEQEALELDELLDTMELREMYNDMNNGREIVRRLKRLERYAGPACDAAFTDFKKQVQRTERTGRIRLFRWASAAAMALLLMAVGGQHLIQRTPSQFNFK